MRKFALFVLLLAPALASAQSLVQSEVPDRVTSSALGALNAAVTVAVSGRGGVGGYVATGTLSGTVTPEVTIDGTHWLATSVFTFSAGTAPARATTVTLNTLFGIEIPAGAKQARIRVSAYTSGTSTGTLLATMEPGATSTTATVSGTVAATQSGTWTVQPGNTANTTAWKVDGSAVTQPVSGTVTANAGTNLNTSLLALEAGGNLAAIKTDVDKIPTSPSTDRTTAGAPFSVELSDGSAFYTGTKTGQLPAALDGGGFLKTHEQGTATVSGTVTANAGTNLNTSLLQLDATGAALNLAQGATTSGETGPLIQGAVTTSAPTYVTAKTDPLSLTTAGALRVDGSGVTQPVSGTVTTTPPANASTNLAQVNGNTTVTAGVNGLLAVGGNVANAGAATANPVPVGGVFTTSPTSLSNGQTATAQFTAAQNLKEDISTVAGTAPTTAGKLDVKGADGDVFVRQATGTNLHAVLDATSTTAVTQATGTNLHAVIDSGTVTANAGTNLNTSLLQLDATGALLNLAQASTTSGQTGPLAQTATTTNAPTYTTAKTNPLNTTTAGALRSDLTTIAGTAPTTPGFVDVKGADGNVFVRQTTASNLNATVAQGTGAAVTAPWPVYLGQPAATTGTITSSASTITATVTGYGIATVSIHGTYAGISGTFQISDDGGTTYYTTTCTRTDTNVQETGFSLLTNASRAWDCSVYGSTNLRVAASAFTSGTGSVSITLSAAAIEAAPTVADITDAAIGTTTAPSTSQIVGGQTSDPTPQYLPIPLTPSGKAVSTSVANFPSIQSVKVTNSALSPVQVAVPGGVSVTNTVSVSPVSVSTANTPGSCVSVTTTTVVLPANQNRRGAVLIAQCDPSACNTDTVFLKFGVTATTANFPLGPGDRFPLNASAMYTGEVDAIANSGTQKICVAEF